MAKEHRGLGRGLNSLLGGAVEEASIASEPRKESQRIVVEEEKVAAKTSSPAKKPPLEPPKRQQISVAKEDVENASGEGITIKAVSERPARQPVEKIVIEKEKVENDVPIDDVFPNPDQPRTNFKKEELEELADSIRKEGLLQPILVREAGDGKYQIIAGERRWQACKLLGMKRVPIRVKEASDDKAIELALIENVQRSDLNPIEEAYGYRRMMERGNMTQSEVARAVSKGRSTIANALRLLELPEEAQQLLFEEKITAGHARAILSVDNDEGRQKLTQKIVEDNLSVRETENLARLLCNTKQPRQTTRQATPSSFKKVARALRNCLETNVRVKTVKGKNKIEIEFKDEDDLQRLFQKLSGEEAR